MLNNYQLAKGLFFKSEDIARIKVRANKSEYQKLWKDVKGTADRMAEVGGLMFPEDTFTYWYYVRKRMMDLAMACMQQYFDGTA